MDEKIFPDNVRQLIADLNSENVRYCHWKSNEHLYEGLVGDTDLDVLVASDDLEHFIMLLKKNNYIKVKGIPWQEYPNVENWIGMCNKTGIQTHMHLHKKMITGKTFVKEQYLPFDSLMLETRKDSEYSIKIADPNLEIIILLVRAVLKRPDFHFIPNNDKEYVFSERMNEEYAYLAARITKKEVEHYLERCFASDTRDVLLKIIFEKRTNRRMRAFKKMITNELKDARRYTKLKSNFLYLYRYLYIKIRQKLHIPANTKKKLTVPGISVALIGVDGSGKTTISGIIRKWLAWKIDCRYVYLGSGDGNKNLINRFLRAYSRLKNKNSGNVKNNSRQDKPSGAGEVKSKKGLKLFVVNLNCCLNARKKYLACKKIKKMKQNGAIVISDRYPQIQFVGINDGVGIVNVGDGSIRKINQYLQKKEKQYISAAAEIVPDVLIKLTIPFEVSRSRKQDSPEETIRRKIDIIDKLTYEGTKEYRIDNSGNIEGTLLKVKEVLWSEIAKS